VIAFGSAVNGTAGGSLLLATSVTVAPLPISRVTITSSG
jgi:hypothetical protein